MPKRKKIKALEESDSEEESNPDLVQRIQDRIYFHSEVNRTSVLKLIKLIDEAQKFAIDHGVKHLSLFIHSEGGDVYAGLSAMNHIQASKIPVTCIADGFVASAATFILLGGSTRLGMEHCMVLIHQMSTGFWGKYHELVEEMQNSEVVMEIMREVYQSTTTMKKKVISKLLTKETMLTMDECIRHGVIHDKFAGKT